MKKKSYLKIGANVLGEAYKIPYLEIQGTKPGKTITLTGGIHGDEVNSPKIMFELFHSLSAKDIRGTVRFFPVLNIPGYVAKSRYFSDVIDLNHIMDGTGAEKFPSTQYIKELLPHILKTDVLIDLHSDRAGLTNATFAYANMKDKTVAPYAKKLTVDAIMNHKPSARTLRGVCEKHNIPCLTLEVGDSLSLDLALTTQVIRGLKAILSDTPLKTSPHIFSKSIWQCATHGGYTVLTVSPKQTVTKGQTIGVCYDLVGNQLCEYKAKNDGYVLVVSKNPVIQKGDKLIHIANA